VTVGASALRAALRRRLRGAILVATLLAASAVFGQGLVDRGPVEWSSLNPAQRSVLAHLQRDWATISPAQQLKWLEVANRFQTLPAHERDRVQQRMAEWSRLTPQERGAARLNFQEAREISPQQRQQQWDAYRALPPEQRRALAERGSPKVVARPRGSTFENGVKSSVVRAPAQAQARPVGPTVVQRGSGASTNLVSRKPTPPLHQQAGLPKVVATPGFVDGETLLPQRGAQGVAAHPRAKVDKKPTPP
jgi:hypothetical protein